MVDGSGDSLAAGELTSARTGATATTACANCGSQRSGRFCATCGQSDRDYKRGLPPLLGDILKETFELDSRIVRTIEPLFLRPGELPAEFSRNRRASYISPIRLYLFSSLAFFFLLSITAEFGPAPRAERALADGTEPAEIEAVIKSEHGDANIDALKPLLPLEQQRKVDEIVERPGMYLSKTMLYGLATADLEEQLDDGFDRYMLARVIDFLEDPKAGFSALLDSLPFAMFVTLPAYALLLMLFFWRRHRFFTEHLVFAVQLHTFAFIVLSVIVLLPDGSEPTRRPLAQAAIAAGTSGASDQPQPDSATSSPRLGATVAVGASSNAVADPADTDDRPRLTIALGNDDEQEDDESLLEDIVEGISSLLLIWILVYHYLALRRYYGDGRILALLKWSLLTVSYAILLIPGILLSTMLAVFQL